MGYEPVVRALSRLIVDENAPDAVRASPEAFLRDAGVSGADLTAMVALGERRLLLYRTLVRRGIDAALRATIPRTAARLGPAWESIVSRFLAEGRPRSHYVRDIAFELVEWGAPRWLCDPDVAPYLVDLARHELLAIEIGCAAQAEITPDPLGLPSGLEPQLDLPLRFEATLRLARYDHAVHLLPDELEDRTVPERRPTVLLAYRDDAFETRYLELSPLAAEILDRLLVRRDTLRDAVVGACATAGQEVGAQVLDGVAVLLADLAGRGVLLGAEPHHR